MPGIPFAISSYERGRGDLPSFPVINFFAEEAATEKAGVVLQSRPGLTDRSANMGSGPVDCLFQSDLVLGSSLFGVSGVDLYSDGVRIAELSGDGPWAMAGYEGYLFIAGGDSLYRYDSTLAVITFPDNAEVGKVLVGASRIIAIRKDTGKFYWSDSLETDIEALDFATAENQPDRLLDMLFIDDTLVLFGAETIEFWPNTGDADLPFQPLEGRVIEKGVKATGCAVAFGPSFAWVTNQNAVCVGDEGNVISNPGLQARIEESTACRLWTFLLEGAEFLCLRLTFADGSGESHVFGLRNKMWSQFTTYGESNWLPQCYAAGVFGSAIDGRTFAWADSHLDLGGDLERRFRGGFPINSGGVDIANVQLRANVGHTTYLSGTYANPQIEMRVSRDAGQTWGDWRQTSLGAQGNYRTRIQWRACGMASQPGFIAEFRCTDPVPLRISDVLINEAWGGG